MPRLYAVEKLDQILSQLNAESFKILLALYFQSHITLLMGYNFIKNAKKVP